jgi:hypothetical protein
LLQCECTGLVTLVTEKPELDFGSTPYYKGIGIQPAPGREGDPRERTAKVQLLESFWTCP